MIYKEGGKILIADLPEYAQDKIDNIVNNFGGTFVDPSEIMEVECDAFAPCALGGILNPDSIAKLKNKVVKQGPYYSRSPSDIVKRAFRNMLPYKNQRGQEAFKRLKCYNSIPSTLLNVKKEENINAKMDANSVFYYTKIEEISRGLGYNKLK
jgi:hypothetical protein